MLFGPHRTGGGVTQGAPWLEQEGGGGAVCLVPGVATSEGGGMYRVWSMSGEDGAGVEEDGGA